MTLESKTMTRRLSSDTSAETLIRCSDLTKHFRRPDGALVRAIDGISIDVRVGEVLVLLGPSGCGKTTLLRSIAGLEHPDSGQISIADETVFSSYSPRRNTPPERRRLSMIFQSYALWPHMTAAENVAYPLKARKVARASISGRVREALEMVEIGHLADQYPGQMSGGQQQRVAFARALVAGDRLILFDEPLSNVDAKVREQLRLELLAMQRKLGFTALYVTHDQTEALAVAHRIAVLQDGRVAQLGMPQEIYERPNSQYVANFVGTMNEILGRVVSIGPEGATIETPVGQLHTTNVAGTISAGDSVAVQIRPECTTISRDEPTTSLRWRGVVIANLFLGPHVEQLIRLESGQELRTWTAAHDVTPEDSRVWVSVSARDARAMSVS
jgi:iron(III) transport system ATP-binding protein